MVALFGMSFLVVLVVLVVRMIHNTASLSWRVRMMQLIRVAEHLGASSRRPRHPFHAQMAGEPLAVYLCARPKNSQPINPEQHLWSCTTGTSTTLAMYLPQTCTCVGAPPALRRLPFKLNWK